MKRLVVLGMTLVSLAGSFTFTAGAEDPTVDATISTKVVAISVSEETLDYGTLMPGDTGKKPNPPGFAVTNEGTVNVDLEIRGSDTEDWTLASLPGEDQLVHYFGTSSSTDPDNILTTTEQFLWGNVEAGTDSTNPGSITVYLMVDMPTETTHFDTQTASVTIIATEN